MHWNKVSSLGHRVHHCHNSIISRGLRELYHKVNAKSVLSSIWYQDKVELSDWRFPREFCAETEITGAHVLPYISRHLGPPIVPGYQL